MRASSSSSTAHERRLARLVASGSAVLLLLAAAYAAFRQQQNAYRAGDWTRHTVEVLSESRLLLSDVVAAETAQRGFLITGSAADLNAYQRAVDAIPDDLRVLVRLTADNPSQQDRLRELTPLVRARLVELAQAIDVRRAKGPQAAFATLESDGVHAMDRVRDAVAAVQDEESRLLASRNVRLLEDRRRASRWIAVFTAVGLALGVFSILALERESRRLRSTRATLRESEERLRTTLSSIGDGVIATDREGRIEFLNPVAEALTGWDAAAADGRSLDEVFRIVNEETRAPVESPVAKVLRTGTVVGLANHTALLARDGRETPIDDSGAPIRGAGDEVRGVVLVFRDVVDRRRAEEQRERTLRAEAANRAKDEFLNTLSHELRSPLNAIVGWVSILKHGAAGADLPRVIEAIERNAALTARLVDDLLDVSRIVAGKIVLDEKPLDLAALVKSCEESIRPAAEAKGLALVLSLEPIGGLVHGDANRLRQAVTNLLSNAVKFTPAGGRVTIAVAESEGSALVSVSDTGRGIAADLLPHVFERYRQGGMRTTQEHAGLGLGLSIVRHLVALHGGAVTASSAGVDRGATFTIRLPLHARDAHVREARAPGASPEPRDAPDLHGVTVLLVEDHADSRDASSLILEGGGAVVHATGSVDDALAVLAHTRPHVIVTDIGMPGRDGYALLDAVRAGDGPRIPVVATTGFAGTDDRARADGAGFDAYLAKPVAPQRLLRAVHEAARLSGRPAPL